MVMGMVIVLRAEAAAQYPQGNLLLMEDRVLAAAEQHHLSQEHLLRMPAAAAVEHMGSRVVQAVRGVVVKALKGPLPPAMVQQIPEAAVVAMVVPQVLVLEVLAL